jgi:hypothetical protein
LLTYENEGNVQVTTNAVTQQNLLDHDTKMLKSLLSTMETNGVDKNFEKVLENCKSVLKDYSMSPFARHNAFQQILWDNVQCHPLYTRSVSFVYVKEMTYEPLSEKGNAFAAEFKSLLGNKLYNLDRGEDRQAIYKAMLIAFKNQVDPQIHRKLEYLQGMGIGFNTHFLHDVANLIKHGFL